MSTLYKVLYREKGSDADSWGVLADTYDAASTSAAARAAAANIEQPGEYAAVPARSWDPISVEIETKTHVKVVK